MFYFLYNEQLEFQPRIRRISSKFLECFDHVIKITAVIGSSVAALTWLGFFIQFHREFREDNIVLNKALSSVGGRRFCKYFFLNRFYSLTMETFYT